MYEDIDTTLTKNGYKNFRIGTKIKSK